jgi:hypothetical protein
MRPREDWMPSRRAGKTQAWTWPRRRPLAKEAVRDGEGEEASVDSGPGCDIGGLAYASGATANDGCESCQPTQSTASWTDAPNGTGCSGGACWNGACISMAICAPGGLGMTNCGPGGSGSESCCTSLEVTNPEATPYYRTYEYGDMATYADLATVSGFRLDKYLVTVGRFRQFVAAWKAGYLPGTGSGVHTHLNGGKGLENSAIAGQSYEAGWDATWNSTIDTDPTDANLTSPCSPYESWTPSDTGGRENLPIDCETWSEAYAFCIWDGGFYRARPSGSTRQQGGISNSFIRGDRRIQERTTSTRFTAATIRGRVDAISRLWGTRLLGWGIGDSWILRAKYTSGLWTRMPSTSILV